MAKAAPPRIALLFVVACGCEWNPWTHVTYLSCAELRPDRGAIPLISQKPFATDGDCRAEASRSEEVLASQVPPKREPTATRSPAEGVECECSWSAWRANFLLTCTGWRGGEPPIRILDRLPFGASKGRRGDAEKSCLQAKSAIEQRLLSRRLASD
jgi:hypothetical protein